MTWKLNTDGQYARLIRDFRDWTPRMNNKAEKARIKRHLLQKASASQFSLLRLKTNHNLETLTIFEVAT